MKQLFEEFKDTYVIQNKQKVKVVGYNDSHIIGAVKDKTNFTWTSEDLEFGSYVMPEFKSCNLIYINCELLTKN